MTDEQNTQDILIHAADHHRAGRIKEAYDLYQEILKVEPDNPDALHLLGLIAYQTKHHEDACNLIRKAIAFRPDDPNFYGNLGTALHAMGCIGEAEDAYRRAAEIKDDFADAHYNLANLYKDRGDFKRAEASYNKVLASDHNHLMAILNLANILQTLGRFDDAEAEYRRVIDIRPDHAYAYRQLAVMRSRSIPQDDLEIMEELLSNPAATDDDTVNLCYGLASAYDARGDYDPAFSFLERGSKIKRASIDYDVDAELLQMEKIAEVFDCHMLAVGEAGGCPSDKPIFVVGMPRSGTSLVEQILASHSFAEGLGEVDYLAERIALISNFPEAALGFDNDYLCRLGESYVEALSANAPKAERIIDKMPINFQFIGMIHLALPNCRIIHCVRNPVDTCLSCFQQLFTNGHGYSYDLEELGRYYAGYARLMGHWHTALPGRIYDLDYAALIADQEVETRKLLGFCGLSFEQSCLNFYKTERSVLTPSTTQVRRPIYGDSVGKWRHYETHLGPLLAELEKISAGNSKNCVLSD